MEDLYAIAPAPRNSEEFVRLSGAGAKYPVFKKHILNIGSFMYQGRKINIDEDFYNLMEKNFRDGVCDTVSVPKVDKNNQHVEDPDLNIGKVIGLSREGNKIYARFEVRDPEAVPKIGTKYLGASALFATNYTDTHTGKKVPGPTLLHMAVTNRPHLTHLDEYESVLLSRVDDSRGKAVILTATDKETNTMDLDELFTALKVDHGIDVPALQSRLADAETQVESAVALSGQIVRDLVDADFVALSADADPTYDEVKAAIDGAREEIVRLSAQIAEINEETALNEASAKVQKLIDDAFITEDKREIYVKLAMTDPETYEALVPAEALVALSAESGTSEDTAPPALSENEAADAELERILGHLNFSGAKS